MPQSKLSFSDWIISCLLVPSHTSHRPVLFLPSEKCDQFELCPRTRASSASYLCRLPVTLNLQVEEGRLRREGHLLWLPAVGSGDSEMNQVLETHTHSPC